MQQHKLVYSSFSATKDDACGIDVSQSPDDGPWPCQQVKGHDGDHTHTIQIEGPANSIVELDRREQAGESPKHHLEVHAAKVLELTEQIEALEAERAQHRTRLADIIGTGTLEIGDYRVMVSLPNRWTKEGKAACELKYPRAQFPQFYKLPELNTSVIDKVEPAIDTSEYKALGDPVVRVQVLPPKAA